MNEKERHEALKYLEKPAYKSKKFKAWFLCLCALVYLGRTALVTQENIGWSLSAFMLGIIFVIGVTTMWLIGKQAGADIFTRGFAFIGEAPAKFKKQFQEHLPEEEEDQSSK